MNKENAKRHTVSELMELIAGIMCDQYCKYPDTWDEEKEGCELVDSEICAKCPLNML